MYNFEQFFVDICENPLEVRFISEKHFLKSFALLSALTERKSRICIEQLWLNNKLEMYCKRRLPQSETDSFINFNSDFVLSCETRKRANTKQSAFNILRHCQLFYLSFNLARDTLADNNLFAVSSFILH